MEPSYQLKVVLVRYILSITQKVRDLFGGRRYEAMSLGELVTFLADEPKPAAQEAFYRKLVVSKVGTRVPNSEGSLPRGDWVTTEDHTVGIPTITRPDGIAYLVVYCDIPSMVKVFPKDTFFELEARVVLEMARSIDGSVIVQNALDGRESWVGVPKEHIETLLSGQYV